MIGLLDIHDALEKAGLPGAINPRSIIERIERLVMVREFATAVLDSEYGVKSAAELAEAVRAAGGTDLTYDNPDPEGT